MFGRQPAHQTADVLKEGGGRQALPAGGRRGVREIQPPGGPGKRLVGDELLLLKDLLRQSAEGGVHLREHTGLLCGKNAVRSRGGGENALVEPRHENSLLPQGAGALQRPEGHLVEPRGDLAQRRAGKEEREQLVKIHRLHGMRAHGPRQRVQRLHTLLPRPVAGKRLRFVPVFV